MLFPKDLFKILELDLAGRSVSEITLQTGIAESSVRRHLKIPDEVIIEQLEWLEDMYQETMSSFRRMIELGSNLAERKFVPGSTFGTNIISYRDLDSDQPFFGIRFQRLEGDAFVVGAEKLPYQDFRVRLFGTSVPTVGDLPALYASLLPILKLLSEGEPIDPRPASN